MTHKDGRCQASERGNENNGRKFHWKLCNDEPPRSDFVQLLLNDTSCFYT